MQEGIRLSTLRLATIWLVLACLTLSCAALRADELVRGIVVDRGDRTLWLGLPVAVEKGTVFNVYLVPGNEAIARATVTEITADPPYVAKASVKLLRSDAFIPVGAYVEVTGDAMPATDEPGGFKEAGMREKPSQQLSFRAGAFFPTGGNLDDETDEVWPSLQLSYRICEKKTAEVQVGIGYLQGNGDFTVGTETGTREMTVIPVTVDARIPMSGTRRGGWFARVGVGAYLIAEDRALGAATTSEDTVTFGWQAGFGYSSARGHSAEISFTDVSDTDFQGLVFSLGTRF